MEAINHEPFHVGDWTVYPRRNLIRSAEVDKRLSPKFMDVLVLLASRSGRVVTRDELLDEVWGGTVVGEAVLTRAVSELRKAFGDDPRSPRFVETVPKKGYRLMVAISAISETGQTEQPDADHTGQRSALTSGRGAPTLILVALAGGILLIAAVALLIHRQSDGRRDGAVLSQRPVTSMSGEEFDAAFSPDGSRIAFARIDEFGADSDLYMLALDGSAPTVLTNTPFHESSPSWSPDQRFIAFVRCDPESGSARIVSRLVSPLVNEQTLTELSSSTCGGSHTIEWSPDGRRIVFSDRDEAGFFRIFVLDLESGTRRAVTAAPPGYHDIAPRVDSQSKRILFIRSRSNGGGAFDLLQVEIDGSDQRSLYSGGFDIRGADWLREEGGIVFASRGGIWRLPPGGSRPEFLASPGVDVVQPVASPVTDDILFVQSTYDVNVWKARPADEHDAQEGVTDGPLLATTRIDHRPRISPDGRRIAFLSDRSGPCSLIISDVDGRVLTPIATFDVDCFSLGTPRWSPDGLTIAVAVEVDDNWDIHTAPAAGGPVRLRTQHESDETAPGWSSDGKTLYFHSDAGVSPGIRQLDLETGLETAGPVATASSVEQSSNGQWFYFTRPDSSGLWRMSVSGGAAERIVSDLSDHDSSWHVYPGGLTFVRTLPDGVHQFVWLDEASELEEEIGAFRVPTIHGATVDTSPEKDYILFSRVDRDEDDLVLLRFDYGAGSTRRSGTAGEAP